MHNASLRALRADVNAVRDVCHQAAHVAGWWHVKCRDFYPDFVDPTNAATVDVRTLPPAVFALWCATKLALILTEGAEAIEGLRTGQPDKHLPQYPSETVELADVVIRVMDYAGGKGLDIGGALVAKLAYNATRADHRPEERAKAGGKEF